MLRKAVDVIMGKLFVTRNVFAPYHYTADNCAMYLKKYLTRGCSVLDIGTGTGILALKAKEYGAGRVLATDIQEEAIQCAAVNCAGTDIELRIADLNHGIDEKFDITIANLYINPAIEFLQYAADTMYEDGLLILTWSSKVSWLMIEEWFNIIEHTDGLDYNTYVLKRK